MPIRDNAFDADEVGAGGSSAFESLLVAAEREACANLLRLSNSEIRLMAGEIEPSEMRTIQAILAGLARSIRSRGTGIARLTE